MVNELDKRQYMLSKLGSRVARMIGLFVYSKEEEGKNYTREDIINGIKSSTDILARKYPAVTDRFICNCVDYFIKKHGKDLSFLMEGRNKKSNVINESIIREMVSMVIKNLLKEEESYDMANDNGYIYASNRINDFIVEYLPQLRYLVSDLENLLSTEKVMSYFPEKKYDMDELLILSKKCLQGLENLNNQ